MMKDGKAEVLDLRLEDDGSIRVRLVGQRDRDHFIGVIRSLCAEGTVFEIVSETEVRCKLPQPLR